MDKFVEPLVTQKQPNFLSKILNKKKTGAKENSHVGRYRAGTQTATTSAAQRR